MVEELYDFFQTYEQYAILISITVSIVVAILGVIPTFFVTAANLLFFGVWKGALISFAGEALGAIVEFYLYRKGIRNMSQRKLDAYPRAKKVINTDGWDAFVLILALRLMPSRYPGPPHCGHGAGAPHTSAGAVSLSASPGVHAESSPSARSLV
jgi:uncharacterized membrane protein YdjX (TVP38/TMEM64 family)